MIGDSTRVAINLRSVEKVSWSRILGGAEITKTVYDSAREMKELAQVQKTSLLKRT